MSSVQTDVQTSQGLRISSPVWIAVVVVTVVAVEI
jgi:hypothetical protein